MKAELSHSQTRKPNHPPSALYRPDALRGLDQLQKRVERLLSRHACKAERTQEAKLARNIA